MEESFEKAHESNIKRSVELILGTKTTVGRIRKSAQDKQRITFCKIIDSLIEAEERSVILDEQFSIDLARYDRGFFDIIDLLFEYSFNRNQIKIIQFFLYDRYTAEGLLQLTDEGGKDIPLETSAHLWEVIKKYQ